MEFQSNISDTPPSNIEAEQILLGSVLFDNRVMDEVVNLIDENMFYVKAHQILYHHFYELHLLSRPIDLTFVVERLSKDNALDSVGGVPYIMELLSSIVTSTVALRYAELILEKYQRRLLIDLAYKAQEYAFDKETSIPEAVDHVEKHLWSISTLKGLQEGYIPIQKISPLEYERLTNLLSGEVVPETQTPTGFYDLDEYLGGGFAEGDLVILAARPSIGKTSLALNIAQNYAKKGVATAVVSLEMSREQLMHRLLARTLGQSSQDIKNGVIKDHENLLNAFGEIYDYPLSIYDMESGTSEIASIKAHSRKEARRFFQENKTLKLIVIDYLQLIGGGAPNNRNQELSIISRELKLLAGELRCTILALSQLSRNVESRNNKRPVLSDLRDSGALEQDADVVMMLYRDEYYNPDTIDQGIAEVIVAKQRNGQIGTAKLLFLSEQTEFRNLSK